MGGEEQSRGASSSERCIWQLPPYAQCDGDTLREVFLLQGGWDAPWEAFLLQAELHADCNHVHRVMGIRFGRCSHEIRYHLHFSDLSNQYRKLEIGFLDFFNPLRYKKRVHPLQQPLLSSLFAYHCVLCICASLSRFPETSSTSLSIPKHLIAHGLGHA